MINYLPGIFRDPQGPQGEKGDKGEPGEQGSPGKSGQNHHLYDANNQDLGILVYAGFKLDKDWYEYTTSLEINGQRVLLNFRNSIITDSWNESYASLIIKSVPVATRCAGQNYTWGVVLPQQIYKDSYSVHPSYFIMRPDTKALRTWFDAYCSVAGIRDNTYLITDISLPFTEPVSWPLEVREE